MLKASHRFTPQKEGETDEITQGRVGGIKISEADRKSFRSMVIRLLFQVHSVCLSIPDITSSTTLLLRVE